MYSTTPEHVPNAHSGCVQVKIFPLCVEYRTKYTPYFHTLCHAYIITLLSTFNPICTGILTCFTPSVAMLVTGYLAKDKPCLLANIIYT